MDPLPPSSTHHVDTPAGAPQAGMFGVPPFTPLKLQRELSFDAFVRWGFVVVVGVALVLSMSIQVTSPVPDVVLLLVVLAWIMLGMSSARVARELPQITAMVEFNPTLAEQHLAVALKRKPLQKWVRLSLYHRLAMLRHRQHRFDEVAAICHTVLTYELGPADRARTHLLLMLAESRLLANDLAGAYMALSLLHQQHLSLIESLQLLALQTRYEVAAGYHDSALRNVKRKLNMAELMPAEQSGAVHAMLGFAASQAGHPSLAAWLRQRAELLCTPDQLKALWEQPIEPLATPIEDATL